MDNTDLFTTLGDALRPNLFNQPPTPHFDGSDYEKELDQVRLTGQMGDIYNLMKDGKWRTLGEIEQVTEHPQASISAQLRNFRKARFAVVLGVESMNVLKQRRGNRKDGLFEYKLEIIQTVNQ